MKHNFKLTLAAALLMSGLSAQVVPNLDWANNLPEKDSQENVPQAIDQNGNIYTIGYSLQSGNRNTTLQKLNANGVSQWIKHFNGLGNGDDKALAIALDNAGNIFICGETFGSGSGKDFITIKYDAGGNQLWASTFNGSGNADDIANSIAVDGNRVFVGGRSTNASGNFDYGIVSYNANTGAQNWTQSHNGTANGDDRLRSLVVSQNNRVFVTGYATNNGTGRDIVTLRLNAANGAIAWTSVKNGTANNADEANAIALDGNDPVICGSIVNSGINKNYYTEKINGNNGVTSWSNTYDAFGNDDQATALVKDATGNFAVTGLVFNGATYEYHTVFYNNSGVQQWVNKYSTGIAIPIVAPKVAVDNIANHFYVCGETMMGVLNTDAVLYQITPGGNHTWTQTYNGSGNATDVAVDLTLNNIGQIYVAAQTGNTALKVDMTTLKYSQTPVYFPPDMNGELGNANHIYWQNKGQILNTNLVSANDVLFYEDEAYPIEYIKKDAVSFVFSNVDTSAATPDSVERVDMVFAEANPNVQFYQFDQTSYYRNYILGHLPSPVSNLYGNRKLFAPNYYPGVDLHYYSNKDGIKIYLVVKPGTNPNVINLKFSGQQNSAINISGELEVNALMGTLTLARPEVYNVNLSGTPVPVTGASWAYNAPNDYGVNTGTYNSILPLVICLKQKALPLVPALPPVQENCEWSTYIGGVGQDKLYDVEHTSKYTFVMGSNSGNNYPISATPLDGNQTNSSRIVVSRFDALDQLSWSTYYGGTTVSCPLLSASTIGRDMDVDRSGFVFVVGATNTNNIVLANPIAGQYLNNSNQSYSCQTGLIARIDSSGQFLNWASLIGDTGQALIHTVSVNSGGTNVVIGGNTNSNGSLMFPAPSGASFSDTTSVGSFVMRFSNTGFIQYGSRLNIQVSAIRVKFNKSTDDYYIFSDPVSTDNPPLVNGGSYFDNSHSLADLYLAKFNLQDTVKWSTLIGGTSNEFSRAIDVSGADEIGLTGVTLGINFPTLFSANQYQDPNFQGTQNIVILKFDSTGQMLYSSLYEGRQDSPDGCAFDSYGNFYVSGHSQNPFFLNTMQRTGFYFGTNTNSTPEGFLLGFDKNDTLIVSTLFGGSGFISGFGAVSAAEGAWGVSVSPQDKLYMVGETQANYNFPLFQTIPTSFYDPNLTSPYSGGSFPYDGYIAKFILAQATIGINETVVKDNGNVFIYPNPNDGNFTIRLNATLDGIEQIQVFDVAGRLVKEENYGAKGLFNQKVVNLGELSNGSYFLNVKTHSKTISAKFILSK